MKTIYFMRHGESEGNVSLRLQQGTHTQLTSQGLVQAERAAQHLIRLPTEAIIASPFARATATAKVVATKLNLPIEYSELVVERRRPSIQLRKRKTNVRSLWAQLQLALFSRFSRYRHSDEETPTELIDRAQRVLKVLSERSEQTLLVVTHGKFMRALYAVLQLGDGVTARTYLQATRTLRMRNTGVLIASYENGVWSAVDWNVDPATL